MAPAPSATGTRVTASSRGVTGSITSRVPAEGVTGPAGAVASAVSVSRRAGGLPAPRLTQPAKSSAGSRPANLRAVMGGTPVVSAR